MVIIKSRPEFKFDHNLVINLVEETMKKNGIDEDVEVGIGIVDEEKMKRLHKKYLETYETTDVLSFPTYEKPLMGDIVICYPVAVRQAKESGRTVDEEIGFLIEHSCKHLLGIHHE